MGIVAYVLLKVEVAPQMSTAAAKWAVVIASGLVFAVTIWLLAKLRRPR